MKLFKFAAVAALAVALAGCGTKQENLVKDFCKVIQSGDNEKMDEFWKNNVDEGFREGFYGTRARPAKNIFAAWKDSKGSAKVETLKTFEEGGKKAYAISATIDGNTLYFVVGDMEGNGKDEILGLTADKKEAMQGGR